MSLADRLSRGLKATFGANVVNMLSNAALIIVLTRYLLTPEEFGRLNFALSVLVVVSILATLGLPKSVARYITDFTETDPGQIPHLVRRSLMYLAALTLVVSVGVVVVGRPVARMLGETALVPFLLVGGGYVAARSGTKFLGATFQGFNRVSWTAIVGVVNNASRLVFVVLFVLLGFGAVGALAGYVAGFVVAAAVGFAALYFKFYRQYEPADEVEEGLTRRMLEYAVPLTATRGANVLDKKVDTVLVGVLMNMTAVGYYTVAKQVADFVAVPAASFGFTISPAIGEQQSGDRLDRAANLYERSLEYVLLAYIPAAAGLILVAEPMIQYVFGGEYLGAVPVVQVFSGFILVNAVNKVTSDGLDYLGRARSRAIVKSATAVSNFVLNLLLIPTMGVVGAAVATVITYSVYTGMNVWVIHGELGFSVRRVGRHVGVVCLVTVGMVAVVVAMLPVVSGIPTLIGAVLAGLLVWGVLAVLGGVLDVREVADFLA
ncbi:flippase (plasmid) [Halorarum halophilum]|uniref:Flippase n=1 Tax=Halorarum halophilum TaxID=2743090 RepID=A0A7D5KHX4_9EURY|nr:flippase [Halobaculum halophilum]QLG29576.1 flippase [Halobaculum halophilum]